ncbi:MAG: DUF86 domain-containing protein [Actinobacteria bacterium]|jgi:uncharacterized protein with HEPN domain|nr:MAG: DUF86 domain-containing protein [Actinomycetota bacterium]
MAEERLILDYLQDILDAMAKARAFLGNMDRREFEQDERTSYAVIRALEVAGEAARHIPEEIVKRYPKIPWSDMIGMRNVLIHDYIEVDLEAVWLTVKDDLPEAEEEIKRTIEELSDD